MARRPRPAAGRRWSSPTPVLLCLVAVACGGGDGPEDGPETLQEPPAEAAQAPASEEPEPRPFLPDEMQRSTRAESFPHAAHGEITCAVCHEVPGGHGSHEAVACAECHRASADARLVALGPEECQSCHHAPDQPLSCQACHESRPTVTSVQELFFEVWDAPRSRPLDFDHGLHGELACASCHQALPALTPAVPCASCHAEHHTVQADCTTCHVEPPEAAHDVRAHLTCSGSGCHRAPDVEAISSTRPVCLSCHQAQQDHEPGGSCIECHQVGGEPTASAVWSHP